MQNCTQHNSAHASTQNRCAPFQTYRVIVVHSTPRIAMNTSNFEEIFRLFQELAQTLAGKNGQRKYM